MKPSIIFDLMGFVVFGLIQYLGAFFYFGGLVKLDTLYDFYLTNIQALPPVLSLFLMGGLLVAMSFIFLNPFRSALIGEYGDAKFATTADLKKQGLLENTGVILGKKGSKYLRYSSPLSTAIIAPPGTGKTAAVIIPTLLSSGNSFVVIDIKGEIYNTTAKRRSEFSEVLKFDPFSDDSCSWNPFAKSCLPNDWDDIVVYVDRLASLQHVAAKGADPHWAEKSRSIFSFIALVNIHRYGETSLPLIRSDALSVSDFQIDYVQDAIENIPNLPQRLIEDGNAITGIHEKEFGSIFSNFEKDTKIYSDPKVAKKLHSCDFQWYDFREKILNLYLVIKNEDLDRFASLSRLLFGVLTINLISNDWKKGDNDVVFIADEFVRMGKVDAIFNAPAISRSYHVILIIVAQSYGQIKEVYGGEAIEVLQDIYKYHVFFTLGSTNTAKMVSEAIGNKTSKKRTLSKSEGGRGGSASDSNEGTPLISHQKLLSLKEGKVLVVSTGFKNRPFLTDSALWFKDKQMKKLVS
jgi:type IV secretion system protein VirD4